MPAVNFKVRWPDGQESIAYSPSTVIYEHLKSGGRYPLADFMTRVETALNAASERVKEVKGFYCSSAMDTLAALRWQSRSFKDGGEVQILDMQTTHAGKVSGGWSSI